MESLLWSRKTGLGEEWKNFAHLVSFDYPVSILKAEYIHVPVMGIPASAMA